MKSLLLVALVLMWVLPAFAEDTSSVLNSNNIKGVLFVDIQTDNVQTYFIPSWDMDSFENKIIKAEIKAAENKKDYALNNPIAKNGIVVSDGDKIVTKTFDNIFNYKGILVEYNSNRAITKIDDKIIACVRSAKDVSYSITPTEKARDTLFSQNINQLASIITNYKLQSLLLLDTNLITCDQYKLKEARANFTYSVEVNSTTVKQANASDTKAAAIKKVETETKAAIAGLVSSGKAISEESATAAIKWTL